MKLRANVPCLTVALLCLCLLLRLESSAQKHDQFELLTTNEGLSQGLVFDIIQDREGFMWFATKDGLNRYDGNEFKVFTNDPSDPWSISGNTIIDLFEDSKGRIWASAKNAGINIYDKKTGRFHHVRHDSNDPTSLSSNIIYSILEDTSGYFICSADMEEVNMFKVEESFFEDQLAPKVIRVSLPDDKDLGWITAKKKNILFPKLSELVKDARDRIWVGGRNAVYQLQVGTAELTLAKDELNFYRASADQDSSFWAYEVNFNEQYWRQVHLYKWGGGKATFAKDSRFDSLRTILCHGEDIWLLTTKDLFGFKLPNENWGKDSAANMGEPFFHWAPDSLQAFLPFDTYPMCIDRSGLIWIGLRGYGVLKVNPKTSRFSHIANEISVRKILLDKDGKLYNQDFLGVWYTSENTYLDRSKFDIPGTAYLPADFLISRNGNYWLKTTQLYERDPNRSLYTLRNFNPETRQSKDYEINWRQAILQPMIETKDGSIWLSGLEDMLTQVNPNTDVVTYYNSISGRIIDVNVRQVPETSLENSTALYEDSNQVLWVGSEQGFSKCIRSPNPNSPLQISNYKNNPDDVSSLSYNHVTSFLDDPIYPDRYLWVSTKGGGLNRFDKETGRFLRLNIKDGLPNDVVYGILADDAGNIWGSTNKGLFCMSAKYDNGSMTDAEYSFRTFSKNDGLQDDEFNTGAFLKLPNGHLAFGGVAGTNVFDPKEVLSEQYEPATYITNILVNNELVKTGDSTGILKNTIQSTKSIELSPTDKVLTVEFAALDFTAPDKIRYRYQFTEGNKNGKWLEAGNRSSATFLNLQPDEYTFRVQGSNSQGTWNGPIAELKVSVLPPWWKTWWAYLLYTCLMLAIVFLYFKFSIKREKLQQQLSYEKREAERAKELDSLKTQLYMNMTHEFRTPLTVILGMAKQMKDNPTGDKSRNLEMVINNGRSMLDMVNQMLNLSRLESGKMSLDMTQGDIVAYLHDHVDSFGSFMSSKEIQLHFLSEVESVVMDFDSDKLRQIVSNLLSNAFKFTPIKGNIYFSIRALDDTFLIKVKDTGKGIPEFDLERIFDRFYQVDNTNIKHYQGSGIGLALTKELVTLMGGRIFAQSPPASAKIGSEFTVILPIRNDAPFEQAPVERQADALDQESLITSYQAAQSDGSIEKPLVLIVEDNQDVAAYVSSCLYSNYRLALAKNGQEGLELAIELIPDLIVSDVMMPIMDGFEFCRKAKSDPRTDHIPVVILTARADFDSKIEGLEIGANAYVSKPFEEQELTFTIKNLLELRDNQHRYYQITFETSGIGQASNEEDVKVDEHNEAPPIEDSFVRKVRLHIENDLDNVDLSVEHLAKAFHLSHSQFRRKLIALTGLSPNKFIRATRLKKAKELLQDSGKSIADVASECGFNDPSYFTRVFKKEFGLAPMEWRSRLV